MTRDLTTAALKASPAVSASAAIVGGLTLQDWVMAATLAYIVLQFAYLCWKWFREWKRSRIQVVPAIAARYPQDE